MVGQLVASGARRGLVAVGRLAFVGMFFPHLRVGRVTPPASLAGCLIVYAGVLDARGHCGRLAAYDPKECEEGDYADSDREKIEVFSIHKARADGGSAGESS